MVWAPFQLFPGQVLIRARALLGSIWATVWGLGIGGVGIGGHSLNFSVLILMLEHSLGIGGF